MRDVRPANSSPPDDSGSDGHRPVLGRLARLFHRPLGPGTTDIRLAGLAGSVLLLVGSLGSGALPVYDPVAKVPGLRWLRSGAGPDIALGLVYAGLAVLGLSWLYLGRAVRRKRPGTGPRDLLWTAVIWGAPLLVAAPLFSRDMYSYAAQAHLTHQGLDPYTNGPASLPGPFLDEVARMWVDTPAPYGPLWLSLGSILSGIVGEHVLLTVFVMRLLAVSGVVLIARYLPGLARYYGVDPSTALWLAMLNPLLMIHFVAGGHNDALMLGFMLAGWSVAVHAESERRLALAVAVTTLGVLIKLPALAVVAFIAPVWARHLTGSWAWARAIGKVAGVSLATFTVVTLATGLGVGWVRQLSTPGEVINWLSLPTGLGLLVHRIGDAIGAGSDRLAVVDSFRLVGQGVTAVALVTIWARSFTRRPERSLALALIVVVVLGPVVQPWYLLWPLTVAAVVPLPTVTRTVIAAVSVFLSLFITPQGATLYDKTAPLLATGLAALVATYAALGREHEGGELGRPPSRAET